LHRLPGQYLNVLLAKGQRRAFSIANAPHEGSLIELHIRRIAGGDFTRQVFDELAPGHPLLIEGPLGTLVPREHSTRPLLFIAGGTGFAPIKALLEHFLHSGCRRPMTLYWGGRYAADLYQHGLLLAWAHRHTHFRYVPVLSEEQGNPVGWRQALVLQAVVEDLADLSPYDVYFSGPSPMIEACRRDLLAAGAVLERLFHDAPDCMPEILSHVMGESVSTDPNLTNLRD